MIVYAVEQSACWPEGPEGQRGLFATRAAAEQYRSDLLRLESEAFASLEEASAADAGYGAYVVFVEEVEVLEEAPQLGVVYTVNISGVEELQTLREVFGEELFAHHLSQSEVGTHENVDLVSKLATTADMEVISEHGSTLVRGTDRVKVLAEGIRLQSLVSIQLAQS